jgi:hypothetical protein
MPRQVSFKAIKKTASAQMTQIDRIVARKDVTPAARRTLLASRKKLETFVNAVCGQTMVVGF